MNKDAFFRYFEQNYIPKHDMLPRIPLGVDPTALWEEIFNRRKARGTQLPILGPRGRPYWYVTTQKMISASETIVEELMEHESAVMGALSPLEEVFYTSYVEGSSMTMEQAMEFLKSDMAPGDIHEQMIVNNRSALSFAGSNLYQPISAEYIRQLAQILTLNMMDGGNEFRKSDWVNIPSMMGEPYELPTALSVPDCVREITTFLSDTTVHPLIKAAVAQAWALVIRPFPEGNERLARLLSVIILSRAGYSFFSEISLSGLIARNGYPYYNAVANILRQENGGDLTYFIEYYLVLLEEAVRERRRRKNAEIEESIVAETELARTVITTQAPQLTEDPDWPPEPGGGSADTVGDRLAADGFEVVEAEEEKDTTAVWNDGTSWAGEARLRSELEAMVKEGNSVSRGRPADRPSLVTRLAESLLICLDMHMYVFTSKALMEMVKYSGMNFRKVVAHIRERGLLESIGRDDGFGIYTFSVSELSEADYSSGMTEALDLLEKSNSSKDRRIARMIRSCLPQGIITIREYGRSGEESKWNDDMKLAEQLGFVRQIMEDRCLIMRDVKPCFELLDLSQRRRAKRMYDSFGEDAFSLEMVVATLDYSSSTASAYLHQFTLLRILDCRKEDVNMYQFLVNPKEHPEVFEDVA